MFWIFKQKNQYGQQIYWAGCEQRQRVMFTDNQWPPTVSINMLHVISFNKTIPDSPIYSNLSVLYHVPKTLYHKPCTFTYLLMTLEAQIQLKQLCRRFTKNARPLLLPIGLEHVTGWKKIDRVMNKDRQLADQSPTTLRYPTRLQQHEPVQYVLQGLWFYGMPVVRRQNALIPG